MGLNCVKAADPLLEISLLFNTKSPEVFGTKEGWKAEVDLGATHWFWIWDPLTGNPVL